MLLLNLKTCREHLIFHFTKDVIILNTKDMIFYHIYDGNPWLIDDQTRRQPLLVAFLLQLFRGIRLEST